MPDWNELFKDPANILRCPQTEALKFVQRLESEFGERPLRIWDFCCGGGRNSIGIAKTGHAVSASDVSEVGVGHLRKWAAAEGVSCRTAVSDMTVNPWPGEKFHGALSWDAIHHNTIANIKRAVDIIHGALFDGGLFLVTLVSVKAGDAGAGREIEKNTFVADSGMESGVPHHYFDEAGVRELFKDWRILILAECVMSYVETEKDFHKKNPFPYTKWNALLRKQS
jgi:SAM-dependent methyltransferase